MSCTDLLSKFDDLVKRFKREFKKIVEVERAKMKAEIETYNAEKQRMKAADVSDDDIIHLNVGGQQFTSTRSTLCQVEGSLLAIMFSGRWERGLKRDEDGAVFFDYNSQYFGFILDYLRAKKIATPENPALMPKVHQDHEKNFSNLVEYLGLSKEIPIEIATEKFNSQEDGKVAAHDSKGRFEYVLGENVYQHRIIRFKLKLEAFQNNQWTMVGILKADVVPQSNDLIVWLFDVNPQYFGYILDYLRARKIATPANPAPLPEVPQNQEKNFSNLVEYLGLSKEIVPTEIATEKLSEKFNSHSRGISVQEGGKVAVHDSSRELIKYVLGENVYQHGITRFKLKLESFQNNNWIMVAILKADVVPQSNSSFTSPGCNGWYLGTGNPGVTKNGLHTTNYTFNVTKQGETVELFLDCDAGKLSLHLPTGQQSHIEIPKSQSWRLHVNLHGDNDKIRIVEVVKA
jgi:hypothetical protein